MKVTASLSEKEKVGGLQEMGTQGEREELRRQWAERLEDWKASGLSIAAWCRQRGEREARFQYWRDKLKPEERIKFVEVKERPRRDTGIVLEVGKVKVQLSCDFDPATLKRVVALLQG